jgi:hypothetical protein
MKHHGVLILAGSLLLAACGGGTMTSPADPAKVRDVVQKTLGVYCADWSGGDQIKCAKDKASVNKWYTEVDIRVTGTGGAQRVNSITIGQSDLDRDKVIKLVGQFGFSQQDFLDVVEKSQRITRGDFVLSGQGAETVVISDF